VIGFRANDHLHGGLDSGRESFLQNMPGWYCRSTKRAQKVLALDWIEISRGTAVSYQGRPAEYHHYVSVFLPSEEAADAGKCPDAAKNEIKLPKYASWANYDRYLAAISSAIAPTGQPEVALRVQWRGALKSRAPPNCELRPDSKVPYRLDARISSRMR